MSHKERRTTGQSPAIAAWFLKKILPKKDSYFLLGDFEEIYKKKYEEKGPFFARAWYWGQLFRNAPGFLFNSIYWSIIMFKNYLKIAFRNILKNKGYSFINIGGLAIAMACCIIILSYLYSEFSYDRFHKNADRIHRLCLNLNIGGRSILTPQCPAPAGAAIKQEFPEVLDTVRLFKFPALPVKYGDKQDHEDNILCADNSIFDVFTFPLIKGNAETSLLTPFSLVITGDIARKYFGSEDPIGKTLKIGDKAIFTVTGVIQKVPKNSHFTFDMLVSFETLKVYFGKEIDSWTVFRFYTYILTRDMYDRKELEPKFSTAITKHMNNDAKIKAAGISGDVFLQPLTGIHLHSHLSNELSANGSIGQVIIFSTIAFFVLIIACINYMNLAAARSLNRAKEIGMRKVLGAHRIRLIKQFIGESLLNCFIALSAALLLAEFIAPLFRPLYSNELGIRAIPIHWFLIGLTGLIVVVGILSGMYPAFFLSKFKPVTVLKNRPGDGTAKSGFRKALVVVQFTVSIALIIGTGIILNQLRYMKASRLGFDKKHVIVLSVPDEKSAGILKEEIKSFNKIISIAAASEAPGDYHPFQPVLPQGFPENRKEFVKELNVDHDYIPTLGMQLAAGRNFSQNRSIDIKESVIINETAAKQFGWDMAPGKENSAVGKTIRILKDSPVTTRTVIGVVKDFHIESLHNIIEPLYITCKSGKMKRLLIKISPGKIISTINFIKQKWHKVAPGQPFRYSFLDESFDRNYRAEKRLSTIISYFTFFAIFVACLGLFGMTSFTVERRTKEIGIRKVFGADTINIVKILNKEFLKLIVIANLLAWPISYFIMNKWLQDFAYRVDIGAGTFLLSGLLALLIALATISVQTLKAAAANPVESLRYE